MPESPPKPWEQAQGTSSATSALSSTTQAITSPSTATNAISSNMNDAPTVPGRPSTMSGTAGYGGMGGTTGYGGLGSSYGSGYGGYSTSGYGSSYGGYGGMNRFGSSMYGSSYGGYGGYGSSMYGGGYGGYGSSMYGGGYNRFGGGMYGAGGAGDEFSMQQRMESSTRATFDVIQQIVGAFGGFAQMLDSTFMATYSSFMAMVGVAEQFGNLQSYLGNLFSIYAWIRWFKRLFYRLRGKEIPPELLEPTPPEQQQGEEGQQLQLEGSEGDQQRQQTKPKRRSILYILALFVGLPYAVYKLVMAAREYHQRRMITMHGGGELATAMYDFIAEGPMEINLRQGDQIHILSKVDPTTGHPSDWWQGRLPNGATGIFPANYVTVQPHDFSRKMR
ncbi:hypothetical protein INT45_013341 [Circinella minor]|uniref:Peroxisomal membrane protein PEX13 n=1 Tax=Circinella minor TaxID=1195481 RepID=A0A8H7VFK4_9FUNG|nr:hypothetical protein INT45_013341 [Circinella minor]